MMRDLLRTFAKWLTSRLWPNAAMVYSVEYIDELGRPSEVTTNFHRARCMLLEGNAVGKRVKVARYVRCGYVREGDPS